MKLKLIGVSLIILAGCSSSKEEAQLEVSSKIDSLQQLVDEYRYSAELMSQVGVYLDSIDLNRKVIAIDLESGINQEDYIVRMKSLNEYTQKAEWTIAELEKTRSAYATQVKRLKKQVSDQADQIAILQISVEDFKTKNTTLENEVTLTREQLIDTQIALNYNEMSLIESDERLSGLSEQLTLSEAETLFAKGEGLELMASKIEFAPKRKKETLEQSLKYYQEAMELGHIQAKAKVEAVQERLK